ncbi:MAG TPA: trigger factor [Mycobacteriales bacterium]|nr:trigger factor [Mycobacteriales bacterium]
MQSSVETLSPTKVKLTVEAAFDELKPELDKAYRTIGSQVKVQGFRPGKVPPRILDQRVGRGAVLEEAVNQAIPRLYGEAVESTSITPLGRPEIDVTEIADNDKLAFTAEVEVRPEFALPDFSSLSVTVDDVVVTDDDVEEQLTGLRERFATLEPVERAAAPGDFVSLDLVASVDGDEVPGGTAQGLSYEVGSGTLLEGIDEAVTGAMAGDARTFQTTLVAGDLQGQVAEVAVTIRTVNERVLPEADDTWAGDAAGFASLAELRADIRTRVDRVKRLEQGVQARDRVLEALLAQVDIPLPESLLAGEVVWREHTTEDQISRSGRSKEQFLAEQGKTAEEWDTELTQGAEQAVKAQLVLDAVADAEQLQVNDAELNDQVIRRAARAGLAPQDYANRLVESGQVGGLIAEVRRGKALATVMEAAVVTDASGTAVDLELLRDDMAGPGGPMGDEVEHDEDGRPFHVHGDGSVHYLDEDEHQH